MLMGSGLVVLYFHESDSTGHAFGPFVQQLKDKVGVHDSWLSIESVSCSGDAGGRGGG